MDGEVLLPGTDGELTVAVHCSDLCSTSVPPDGSLNLLFQAPSLSLSDKMAIGYVHRV